MRELTMELASDAFRFWGYIELLSKRTDVPNAYRAMLTADIYRPPDDGIKGGVGSPTEAQVIAMDRRIDEAAASLADLEAVGRVLEWVDGHSDRAELMDTLREIYMSDLRRPMGWKPIRDRVSKYARQKGYASSRTVYRRLKMLRLRWAEERGLRIFEYKATDDLYYSG